MVNRKRYLLVDLELQEGHINFNRAIIEAAREFADIDIQTSKKYGERLAMGDVIAFRINEPAHQNGLNFRIWQLRVAREVLSTRSKYDRIVFLGIDLMVLALVVRLFESAAVAVIVHNQLDFKGSRLKWLAMRSLPGSTVLFVMARYMVGYVERECAANAIYFPHPLYAIGAGLEGRAAGEPTSGRVIFSPSRRNAADIIRKVASTLRPDERVICRSDEEIDSPVVRRETHFADYKELMNNCDAVLIAAKSTNRVSGVAFDGIDAEKPLIMPDCEFSRELKEDVPSCVNFLEEFSGMDALKQPKSIEIRQFKEQHSGARIARCLAAL